MIFYFSATGNSQWVARTLSDMFSEDSVSITEILQRGEISYTYVAHPQEKIIFVFPVHSWGPALAVTRFLDILDLKGACNVWAVCTCGDECGRTREILRSQLKKKGLNLQNCFSVKMPNDYILMKGFGVDSPEVESRKLSSAPLRMAEICKSIVADNLKPALYEAGSWSFLKSGVVYPLFKKFNVGKSKFYVKPNCIGCGLCKKVCPSNNIVILSSHPNWANDCLQCTACINQCPVNAIEFGKITESMGRYSHPILGPKKRQM